MTDIPPVDRSNQCLVGGGNPEDNPDYRDLRPDGQQKDYVVLCDAERAKGFVRPVRRSYRHVGAPHLKNGLRDLTEEEKDRYAECGYVKFEKYPDDRLPVTGRFWTQAQLDRIGRGCQAVTTMSQPIAETYARDPGFYGATFCSGCHQHHPVGEYGEFVWEGADEMVGT